jgi:hypothetical protein
MKVPCGKGIPFSVRYTINVDCYLVGAPFRIINALITVLTFWALNWSKLSISADGRPREPEGGKRATA